ncbi:DNA-binding protein [Chytriomyces sp. MP71]|nr:DNA-binding protein [Chytriomyces sp. MP71]
MSVVQIHRPVVVAAPPTTTTATASVTESLQLTQNLLRSSIATISYLRGLFPEDHFDDSRFNGMGLKRMKRGASPRMDALVESLESGCFDALQKGYLRKIVFSVHHGASAINEDNKENNVSGACAEGALIESYEFEFKYPSTHEVTMTITAGDKSKATSKAISKKESVKAMADLLRRIIILTQTLQPLPDNAEFTTRIYYYGLFRYSFRDVMS